MSLPAILRAEAEDDIQVAHRNYETVRAGLGDRFVAKIRETLQRIEDFPAMYGIVWQDVRAARIRKFRYLVYYVVFDDRIEVLAVMHGARHASEWQSRV